LEELAEQAVQQQQLMWPVGQKGFELAFRKLDEAWRWQVQQLQAMQHTAERVSGANTLLEEQLGQAEAEVERLRTRFALILKATSDGLWDMVVPDGAITLDQPIWWSDQFRGLLGFRDEAEFPNVLKSWAERLHPADKERTLAAFNAHLNDPSGRTHYDVVYRLACRDGAYRSFRARGETLRDGKGKPLRVAGSMVDITEQLAQQSRLDTAVTRFELSVEMLNDGLWDMEVVAGDPVNPHNAFWWSHQLRRLLGYDTVEEFPDVLESWASKLHPD
jgi:PAS domain-containing protein